MSRLSRHIAGRRLFGCIHRCQFGTEVNNEPRAMKTARVAPASPLRIRRTHVFSFKLALLVVAWRRPAQTYLHTARAVRAICQPGPIVALVRGHPRDHHHGRSINIVSPASLRRNRLGDKTSEESQAYVILARSQGKPAQLASTQSSWGYESAHTQAAPTLIPEHPISTTVWKGGMIKISATMQIEAVKIAWRFALTLIAMYAASAAQVQGTFRCLVLPQCATPPGKIMMM
ncbi:hypothetical protein BKA67DRAFT_530315 [Truncatella angustata]|uniref:Uncharacterized protein n=1 Tax=Truncatella angustata TaxID=152316 RepID=A0A9P9A4E1_9PEZI|nr:uncharacterized protein BKA67DRAFT_530315 [Truncatella angustata]KAH6660200.1 hypothetical protein BKA67DRAFT_530315 [Truncatella angustata]